VAVVLGRGVRASSGCFFCVFFLGVGGGGVGGGGGGGVTGTPGPPLATPLPLMRRNQTLLS